MRVPSVVQTTSPAVLTCRICSSTSRRSDVENPEPNSVNTTAVAVVGRAVWGAADGADGEESPQPASGPPSVNRNDHYGVPLAIAVSSI